MSVTKRKLISLQEERRMKRRIRKIQAMMDFCNNCGETIHKYNKRIDTDYCEMCSEDANVDVLTEDERESHRQEKAYEAFKEQELGLG